MDVNLCMMNKCVIAYNTLYYILCITDAHTHQFNSHLPGELGLS